MDYAQFAIFLITLASLFLWNRSESNADRREIHAILRAIQEEMKDFHNRLCQIEAQRK